jgi:hypothetical protein
VKAAGLVILATMSMFVAGTLYFDSREEPEQPTIPALCDRAMIRAIAVDSCRSDARCVLTVADYEQHIELVNFGREYCSNERKAGQKPKETLRAGQE